MSTLKRIIKNGNTEEETSMFFYEIKGEKDRNNIEIKIVRYLECKSIDQVEILSSKGATLGIEDLYSLPEDHQPINMKLKAETSGDYSNIFYYIHMLMKLFILYFL